MPDHNHRGPRGEGPMTGRKQGECNRKNNPEEQPRLGLNSHEGEHRGKGCKHDGHHHDDHHHHNHHN